MNKNVVSGFCTALGLFAFGYCAGKKKAELDEKSIYRRINQLEIDVCILKQRMNHLERSSEEKGLE